MQVARSFEHISDEAEARVTVPKTFRHHRVEVIVIMLDEDERPIPEPHPAIVGKGRRSATSSTVNRRKTGKPRDRLGHARLVLVDHQASVVPPNVERGHRGGPSRGHVA
jgi:hypothetical protein